MTKPLIIARDVQAHAARCVQRHSTVIFIRRNRNTHQSDWVHRLGLRIYLSWRALEANDGVTVDSNRFYMRSQCKLQELLHTINFMIHTAVCPSIRLNWPNGERFQSIYISAMFEHSRPPAYHNTTAIVVSQTIRRLKSWRWDGFRVALEGNFYFE